MTREIIHAMIQGNPHIKNSDKPSKEQIYKLSFDGEKKEGKKITPEELAKIEKELRERHGATQSNS